MVWEFNNSGVVKCLVRSCVVFIGVSCRLCGRWVSME